MTRRRLLGHLGTGLGLGAFALAGCARRDLTPLGEALARLTGEREAAVAIGGAYAAAHDEDSHRDLLERLAVDLDWREGQTDAELAASLRLRIETDFRDARTVRVESWILSQTETRWAAVVALG
jgi:hypothetical protein